MGIGDSYSGGNVKHALIFPGQGAQKPGMGKEFYEGFLAAKEVFQEADEILSFSLSRLIFTGTMEELTRTEISQPAIFVVSMAILKVMEQQFPEFLPQMCGGLSLGEYAAVCAAKNLDFVHTLQAVAKRGQWMQEACEEHAGAMLVVMGLSEEKLSDLWVANVNCPGQIVVACLKENVDSITNELLSRGAKRVIPLPVSGAFHSPLMEGAQVKMAKLLETMPIQESPVRLVMNVVGGFVTKAEAIRENLILQVAKPTRWMACVEAMQKEATHFFEVGPTQLLSMQKKIGVTVPSIGIENVEDLEKVYAIFR